MKTYWVAWALALQALATTITAKDASRSPSPERQHTFESESVLAKVASADAAGPEKPWWELHSDSVDHSVVTPRTRKVAVIGGGAGGSSAAHFLWRAHEKFQATGKGGDAIQATLFERDERIGGRAAVAYPYENESYPAIELGASIFAQVNLNMLRATKQFDLPQNKIRMGDSPIALWDGQQFIVENVGGGWWSNAKVIWRYGYSPMTAVKMVKPFIGKIGKLYDPVAMHKPAGDGSDGQKTEMGYPWRSIEDLADTLDAREMANTIGEDHFVKGGVSKLFTDELLEAATLGNYAQEVGQIHAVGASVCLAVQQTSSIKGGNYRIFEHFVRSAEQTRLRMGVHGEVTGLARFHTAAEAIAAGKLDENDVRTAQWTNNGASQNASTSSRPVSNSKWWLGTKSGYGDFFDAVFVATPWHNSGITLLNTNRVIPTVEYKRVHSTVVVTTAPQPNPAYFGRGEKDSISNSIVTTHVTRNKQNNGAKQKSKNTLSEKARHDGTAVKSGSDKSRKGKGKGKMPAKSIHADLRDQPSELKHELWPWGGGGDDKEPQFKLDFHTLSYLREISSPNDDNQKEWVVRLHSDDELSDAQLEALFGQNNVKWTKRKAWDAFPILRPTLSYPPIEKGDNLFYLNAMEPFVSTMETTTINARNSIALWLEREYGSDFVHGGENCPWDEQQTAKGKKHAFRLFKNRARPCPWCLASEDESRDWSAWGCQSA